MKICSRCKTQKSLDQFHKDTCRKDGHGNFCKPCSTKYGHEWCRRHREYVNERARTFRGGYKGNQAHLEADSDRKQAARSVLSNGGEISTAIECLMLAQVQRAICGCMIAGGGYASLDTILSFVYGDEPEPNDRRRQYNTLKRQIFTVRKRLKGSGIALVNCGYAKGYSLVIEAAKGVAQ